MTTEPPLPAVGSAPSTTPLRLELRDGRMQIRTGGVPRVELSGATVGLVIRRGARRIAWQAESLRADGLAAQWEETGVRFELRSAEVDGALVLHVALEHGGDEPMVLEEITVLSVTAPGAVRVGAD